MKHCIQINIGDKKYQFDIEIKKESELLVPFHDLLTKVILKNPDNLNKLKEIESSLINNTVSNSKLNKILKKETLTDEDIESLLSGYAGNTSIYNIASYFNSSRQSEKLLALTKAINNVHLMRSKFDTSSFDVFISHNSVNRVVIGNKRTIIILNPRSSPEESISLLSTVYALNQLREPTSSLFRAFRDFVEKYEGNLKSELEGLSMIDKCIYLFANPNLDIQSKSYLNGLISKNISDLITISQEDTSTSQEDVLLSLMSKVNTDKVIEKNGHSATIKELLNFRNGLYSSFNEPSMSEEDFKKAFGLDVVDPDLYKSYMFSYLVKHKEVAEVVYSQLSEIPGKNIIERLKKAVRSLLVNEIPITDTSDEYIANTNIAIKSNTKFYQNRWIKIRHDSNYNKKCVIITNKVTGIRYDDTLNSIYVNPDYALTNKKDVKKYISKYDLYQIKFEQPFNIDGILNLYKNELSYVLIKDKTPNDLTYAKAANASGYQVSLYPVDNTDINRYLDIMPVYSKPLAVRHKARRSQMGLFNILDSRGFISIPVTVKNELNYYNIGDVLNIYNEANLNQVIGIKIKHKTPLFYQDEYRTPSENTEIGDMLYLNGKTAIFLGNDKILIDNEIKDFVKKDGWVPVIKDNMQVTARRNGNFVWAKQKNEVFINTEKLDDKPSKLDFFKSIIPELSEKTGISQDDIKKILVDKKQITLFNVEKTSYKEETTVTPPNKVSLKYFTVKDMIEKINTRLSKEIEVVWFNDKTNKLRGINFANYRKTPAFTHDGVIFLNEKFMSINSYVHELSHVILAALRIKNPDKYQELLSKIDDIPKEFIKKYPDLTRNDLKEEYLVYLFSENFKNVRSDLEAIENSDWESTVKDIFNLSETSTSNELVQMMNSTIQDMLQVSEDGSSFSKVFKENKYRQITKLAAIKEQLKKDNILNESCK